MYMGMKTKQNSTKKFRDMVKIILHKKSRSFAKNKHAKNIQSLVENLKRGGSVRTHRRSRRYT